MKIPRIMIAAQGSGSGKTLLTCTLLQALKNQGLAPSAFKCGPDYIDPMFHQKVIGVSSRNLDTFFSDEEQIRALFCSQEQEIAVLEGVMGLYDGLGGIQKEGSAYHLASVLKAPIVLVIHAHGMGRSLLALIAGFLQYDTEHLIVGVILNRISKGFYETVKDLIESELHITVFGYFPEQKNLQLESRHLGLKMPEEIRELKEQIVQAADVLEETVDLAKLKQAAEEAPEINPGRLVFPKLTESEKVKIAVARDEAFCFYYDDNLWMLEQAGAELLPFSPLHDKELPEGVSGLIFGGGYPELFAEQLEENQKMRQAVRTAIEQEIPSIAECGGFMYLHETLIASDEKSYSMCGLVPGSCRNTGKLVRFGYIGLEEKAAHFLGGREIRGHEFHYYDSEANGTDCIARKPVSGKSWECVHQSDNHWWGYPHLYYHSNPAYVSHFLERAVCYAKRTS